MSAGGLSYSGLTTNRRVTLPSVESWSTNMNILQDPPKGVYTRRIDRTGQTNELLLAQDDSGDRISECINVYARGVNPMSSVSFMNSGATAGTAQGRQVSLPYKVENLRPPVLRQEDLLPLSRLPRVWCSAFTNPEFPSFEQARECPADTRNAITMTPLSKGEAWAPPSLARASQGTEGGFHGSEDPPQGPILTEPLHVMTEARKQGLTREANRDGVEDDSSLTASIPSAGVHETMPRSTVGWSVPKSQSSSRHLHREVTDDETPQKPIHHQKKIYEAFTQMTGGDSGSPAVSDGQQDRFSSVRAQSLWMKARAPVSVAAESSAFQRMKDIWEDQSFLSAVHSDSASHGSRTTNTAALRSSLLAEGEEHAQARQPSDNHVRPSVLAVQRHTEAVPSGQSRSIQEVVGHDLTSSHAVREEMAHATLSRDEPETFQSIMDMRSSADHVGKEGQWTKGIVPVSLQGNVPTNLQMPSSLGTAETEDPQQLRPGLIARRSLVMDPVDSVKTVPYSGGGHSLLQTSHGEDDRGRYPLTRTPLSMSCQTSASRPHGQDPSLGAPLSTVSEGYLRTPLAIHHEGSHRTSQPVHSIFGESTLHSIPTNRRTLPSHSVSSSRVGHTTASAFETTDRDRRRKTTLPLGSVRTNPDQKDAVQTDLFSVQSRDGTYHTQTRLPYEKEGVTHFTGNAYPVSSYTRDASKDTSLTSEKVNLKKRAYELSQARYASE